MVGLRNDSVGALGNFGILNLLNLETSLGLTDQTGSKFLEVRVGNRTCSLTNKLIEIVSLEITSLGTMVLSVDDLVFLAVESGELHLLSRTSLVTFELEGLSGTGVLGVGGHILNTLEVGASGSSDDLKLLANESGVYIGVLGAGELSVLEDVLHADLPLVAVVLADTFEPLNCTAESLNLLQTGVLFDFLDDLGLLLGLLGSLGSLSELGLLGFQLILGINETPVDRGELLGVVPLDGGDGLTLD